MAEHTTFRVGGPADYYAVPLIPHDIRELLRFAREAGIPVFVLGGGANVLVSDAGVRGLVIDMTSINGIRSRGTIGDQFVVEAGAGLPISEASAWAAENGLAGLEFIYSMPGSVAGAVWMNARCYGADIAGVLAYVDLMTANGRERRYQPVPSDFAYKRSPFQGDDTLMVNIGFKLALGDKSKLWDEMKAHETDRRSKGHFDAPCAGSFFKNNRAFGKPTGALLDELGLRGSARGGARVSDKHANIMGNAGGATATDILALANHMAAEAKRHHGVELEREVVLVGEWDGHDA